MSASVVFQWCDGGILRQIQLEKASLAYRSIMAIIATVQQQEPNTSGAGQASQAVANGPKQLALTPGEDPRSAAVAPRDTSPGLGPVVDNPPGPLVRRSKPKTTADIPEEPLPKKPKRKGLGEHGGPLAALSTASEGVRSGNVTNENVAPMAVNCVAKNELNTAQAGTPPAHALPNGTQLHPTPTSVTHDNGSAAAARRTTSPAQGPYAKRSTSRARSPATNTVSISAAQAVTSPAQALSNGSVQLEMTATSIYHNNSSAAAVPRATSPARGPSVKRSTSRAIDTGSQATAQPTPVMPNGSAQLNLAPTTSITQENRSAAAARRAKSPARGHNIKKAMSPARSLATTTVCIKTAQAMAQPQAFPNGSMQLDLTPTTIVQENRSAATARRATSPARGPNIKRFKSPARSAKARNGNHVHRVQCDECAARGFDDPIAGVRYKCAVCDHYDLCSKCERRGLHDHHIMLRFGRIADKILNWTSDARELHENLVKLQEQIYPPAKNDGEDRLVEVRRDANAVHGVTCKECGEQVVGVRYKCGVCPNHDICSECEANGVHDKHITFRFSGVVSEITSWKQVERQFGVKLVDELKSLQHKVAGTTATKPTNKGTGETSNGTTMNEEMPPSETTQEPPMTLADALKEVESAARAMRMRELSEIAANLDLIKSGERIAEALEQLDNASMAGGRVSYLGAWNTVSAVRNHPQHGAAARRLLAKWAAMMDAEARRERIRNSLRVACAQAPGGSQAPECSGSSVAEANAAPPTNSGGVENEAPPTPNGVSHGGTQRVVLRGAAPRKTADVLEEPSPMKTKMNGVGAHGGALPATGTASEGARNRNVTNENVAPKAKKGVVKNEPPPTPDGILHNGTQQVGLGGAAPHRARGAPAIDMKATESTLLSLASYVAHTRGGCEAIAYEDAAVTDGTVKSGPHLGPNNLPVEAVEALAAAIAALADELPTSSTVKMEPAPPPTSTSNVYDRLVCHSGM